MLHESLYVDLCHSMRVKICPDVEAWFQHRLSAGIDEPMSFDSGKMYVGQTQLATLPPLFRVLPSLQSILLPGTNLTDDFVRILCSDCLAFHPSVHTLVLDGNSNLSHYAGNALLEVAVSNPNIRTISMKNTNIPETTQTRITLQLEENDTKAAQNPRQEYDIDPYSSSSAGGSSHQDEEWEWCSNHGDIDDAVDALRTVDTDTQPEPVVAPLNVNVDDILRNIKIPWRDEAFCYEKFGLRLGTVCPDVFRNAKVPSQPLLPQKGPKVRGVRYLVNALAILTQHPSLLQQIFLRAHVDIGLYELQLFLNGAWVRVLVDDYVPKITDIIRCSDPGEMWASLIEKAYAKYYGGYDKLSLGSTTTALIQLTGGSAHTLLMKTLSQKKQLLAENLLWSLLRGYMAQGYIIAFVCRAQRTAQQLSLSNLGFAANRCYTLLEMKDDKVVLHNPVPEEVPLPAPWLEFAQLITLADKIYILRPHDSFRCTFASFCGTWFDRTAGGNHIHHYFLENPTYRITAPNKLTAVFVELTVHLGRTREVSTEKEIAIYVLGKHRTPPAHSAHVATEFFVGPDRPQEIVCCTERPGVSASYSVYFSSRHTFHVEPLRRNTVEYTVRGRWETEIPSGGHPRCPTWKLNPQYLLRLDGGGLGMVQVVLSTTTERDELRSISVMVVEASARLSEAPACDSQIVKAMPPFRLQRMLTTSVILSAGTYVLVPMTWRPSQQGEFRLSVFTENPAVLKEMKFFQNV